MFRKFKVSVLALVFSTLAVAVAAHASDAPEMSHDGLQRVESKYFKEVYVRPGASFDQYTKMALLDC